MKINTGSYILPYFGYPEAGDLIYEYRNETQLAMGVYDVTGHGTEAAKVANKIKAWSPEVDPFNPIELLTKSHEFLLAGTGSAVAVSVCIDLETDSLVMSGVGNVECWHYSRGKSTSFTAKPGLLGVTLPRLITVEEKLIHGDIVLIASDGIRFAGQKGGLTLTQFSPEDMANKMVRQFGRKTDDVSCIVARCEDD